MTPISLSAVEKVQALRSVMAVHIRLDDQSFPECLHCRLPWPCATVRAVSAAGIDTGEAGT